MKPIILEQIPEYVAERAAIEREEAEGRELPFFDLPILLCGIEVKQFTPRLFVTLCTAESPFLCGGEPEPEDIAQFLWAVSAKFSVAPRARAKFTRSLGALDYISAVTEIRAYIADSLKDRPGGDGSSTGRSSPIASFAASLVHRFAFAYGWSRQEIIDTPFAELFQYLRLIERDEYTRAGKPYHAPSIKVLRLNKRFLAKIEAGEIMTEVE